MLFEKIETKLDGRRDGANKVKHIVSSIIHVIPSCLLFFGRFRVTKFLQGQIQTYATH